MLKVGDLVRYDRDTFVSKGREDWLGIVIEVYSDEDIQEPTVQWQKKDKPVYEVDWCLVKVVDG